jgi:hypothetical protein
MLIGHNAVAFACKRIAPKTSLGVLTAAVMLPDLVWPIFLLTDIEHVRVVPGITKLTPLDFYDYPWSHSLLMSIYWGGVFALAYWVITRYGRGALVVAMAVVSHWVLDFIVHGPDLPLWPTGPKVGLGLWNHPMATMAIEAAMFAIGFLIYRDVTKPRDRVGSIVFWAFIIVLAAIYAANVGGPPPRDWRVVAKMALGLWLLPFFAAWFDDHRQAAV